MAAVEFLWNMEFQCSLRVLPEPNDVTVVIFKPCGCYWKCGCNDRKLKGDWPATLRRTCCIAFAVDRSAKGFWNLCAEGVPLPSVLQDPLPCGSTFRAPDLRSPKMVRPKAFWALFAQSSHIVLQLTCCGMRATRANSVSQISRLARIEGSQSASSPSWLEHGPRLHHVLKILYTPASLSCGNRGPGPDLDQQTQVKGLQS